MYEVPTRMSMAACKQAVELDKPLYSCVPHIVHGERAALIII